MKNKRIRMYYNNEHQKRTKIRFLQGGYLIFLFYFWLKFKIFEIQNSMTYFKT